MTSSDFASQALGAPVGVAGDQIANFLGGLLLNALLEGMGFSTEASELEEILQLEQAILSELNALSSQIDLQSVNIESFSAAASITNAFVTMQGFAVTPPDAQTLNDFVAAYADVVTGIGESLTQYQMAIMQGQTVSVGPGKSVFSIVSAGDHAFGLERGDAGHTNLIFVLSAEQTVLPVFERDATESWQGQ